MRRGVGQLQAGLHSNRFEQEKMKWKLEKQKMSEFNNGNDNSDGTGAASSTEKTPFDILRDSVEVANAKYGTSGQMCVRCLDDGKKDEDEDNDDLTKEQCDSLRFILTNNGRDKAIKYASNFATCGQAGDGIMMFNTTTGNQVCYGLEGEVKKAQRKKSKADRFNALFALTWALKNYDHWLKDNECYGEEGCLHDGLNSLGKAWKTLLKESNETLCIDPDFTRPGIEALLESFASLLEEMNYSFSWD
jgi:hypothetical protein